MCEWDKEGHENCQLHVLAGLWYRSREMDMPMGKVPPKARRPVTPSTLNYASSGSHAERPPTSMFRTLVHDDTDSAP